MPDEETVVVKLEAPFAGWEATMVADPEWGYLECLDSGDARVMTAGMAKCLRGWNWRDREGKALPATAEGISRAPRRAVVQLLNKYGDLYRALPNGQGSG